MTRADIKAELRRSACEDEFIFLDVKREAGNAANEFWTAKDVYIRFTPFVGRVFYLLVAEAL